MKLAEYIMKHARRGACECGRCASGCKDGPKEEMCGFTINLTFFTVGMQGNPDVEVFRRLVIEEQPHWLDGKERNYLECGSYIGDQGIALMTMGMGHLLDVWECRSPETMMPMLDDETKKMMAGQGMVTIQVMT